MLAACSGSSKPIQNQEMDQQTPANFTQKKDLTDQESDTPEPRGLQKSQSKDNGIETMGSGLSSAHISR